MRKTLMAAGLCALLSSGLYATDTGCDVCGDDSGKLTKLILENDLGEDKRITVYDTDGNLLIDQIVDNGKRFSFQGGV